MTKEKLQTYLELSVKAWHGRFHYEYQKKITRAILQALVDAENGITSEIPIELPRQAGKTTAVVDLTEFILSCFRRYFGRPLPIGIFAPEKEQATTDFDRLKMQFAEIAKLGFKTKIEVDGDLQIPEKYNSKTIRLFSKSNDALGEVYIFPLRKGSRPESKTLGLAIFEEAQDVDDDRMKNAAFPMLASTNGPRIYIGTAGTKLCYFKHQLDTNPRKIIIPLEEVLADRQKVADESGDLNHLKYKIFIDNEIKENGRDSDYIQRQYFLKWKIGSGQFTTSEILDKLVGPHGIIGESKTLPELDEKGQQKKDRRSGELKWIEAPNSYVGIDSAKSPDATVVTVVRDSTAPEMLEAAKKAKAAIQALLAQEEGIAPPTGEDIEVKGGSVGELCNWLVLRGTNYEDQFEIIKDWLQQFENIQAIAMDATGQGDFFPDKFERHTHYNIIRVKFSAETKDVIYKNLDQVIRNALTLLPNDAMDANVRQFIKEMVELEKEYKGRLLSVHHPDRTADGKMGHDDFPDSWALAEYAKSEIMRTQPGLIII